MYQKYYTEALVLGSRERGEADRTFTLYTKDFGLVHARATGVRRESSRMRYALRHYARAHVALVRGKQGWRLGGAIALPDNLPLPAAAVFARIARLVLRLVAGEEHNEYLFDGLSEAHRALSKNAPGLHAVIEIVCVARVLFALGYLSSEALQTTLFAHAAYTEKDMREADMIREKLIVSINRAFTESHL